MAAAAGTEAEAVEAVVAVAVGAVLAVETVAVAVAVAVAEAVETEAVVRIHLEPANMCIVSSCSDLYRNIQGFIMKRPSFLCSWPAPREVKNNR